MIKGIVLFYVAAMNVLFLRVIRGVFILLILLKNVSYTEANGTKQG